MAADLLGLMLEIELERLIRLVIILLQASATGILLTGPLMAWT